MKYESGDRILTWRWFRELFNAEKQAQCLLHEEWLITKCRFTLNISSNPVAAAGENNSY